MIQHTIEVVLEPLARCKRNTIDFCARKNSIQSQTEEVVAKSADESLQVEQAAETSPSYLSLQLLEIER